VEISGKQTHTISSLKLMPVDSNQIALYLIFFLRPTQIDQSNDSSAMEQSLKNGCHCNIICRKQIGSISINRSAQRNHDVKPSDQTNPSLIIYTRSHLQNHNIFLSNPNIFPKPAYSFSPPPIEDESLVQHFRSLSTLQPTTNTSRRTTSTPGHRACKSVNHITLFHCTHAFLLPLFLSLSL
jgi:hypothetical protein